MMKKTILTSTMKTSTATKRILTSTTKMMTSTMSMMTTRSMAEKARKARVLMM